MRISKQRESTADLSSKLFHHAPSSCRTRLFPFSRRFPDGLPRLVKHVDPLSEESRIPLNAVGLFKTCAEPG